MDAEQILKALNNEKNEKMLEQTFSKIKIEKMIFCKNYNHPTIY